MWQQKISWLYRKFQGNNHLAILARGATNSFMLKIIGTGVVFLVQVAGANLLGAEGYGIYAYSFAWMSMLALLGQMGFDTASVRYIAAYESQQQWGLLKGFLDYSNKAIALMSLLAGVGLAVGAWLFRHQITTDLLYSFYLAGLLLPVTTFLKIQHKRFLALKQVFLAQFPMMVLRNLLILGGLGLFSLTGIVVTPSHFMFLILLGTTSALLVSWFYWHQAIADKIKNTISQFERQEWLTTAQGMILVAGLEVVLSQSDTIMLGVITGTTETGLYAAARKISSLLVFPLLAVNSILSPMVVTLYTQKSQQQLQKVVNVAVNGIFGLTLIIGLVIAFNGKFILSLFGTEFSSSYFLLLIHLLGQLINGTAGPVSLLLNMTGYHNDTAKILLVSAVINVLLNIVLIPEFGAVGASLATAIATIIWNVTMTIFVWQRLKIISVVMPAFLLPKIAKN
jgi:O-antigen/teichoic acid export membrane protein